MAGARVERMPATPLTPRALNRATLARQMLLAREKLTPVRAIERLAGLQAQLSRPPFIGLWSRLAGFEREDLMRSLHRREVVRATLMRGTLHLMSAKDYGELRGALQPALTLGTLAVLRVRAEGSDVGRLIEAGRTFFGRAPQTFEAFRDVLAKQHPKGDIRAFAYIVRTHLPLVQVPSDASWGFPATSDFTLAESWLGTPVRPSDRPEPLALRYLAAFGPATPADFQTWSGLPGPTCRAAFETLGPQLRTFEGERGRTLFDLATAPRPAEDTEAPARFLPEFDNLVLAHADRRRFIADDHRRFVYLPGLRVAPTILVDGLVAGTWGIERKAASARLVVRPFAGLPAKARDELAREGDRLVRFVEADAHTFEVRTPATRVRRRPPPLAKPRTPAKQGKRAR